jgi:hypothetical protein
MWNFSAERNMSLEEDLSAGGRNDTNATDYTGHEGENSLSYKIIATILHVLILVGGLFGNIVLVLVVRKTRSLHTPTYYYLVGFLPVILQKNSVQFSSVQFSSFFSP